LDNLFHRSFFRSLNWKKLLLDLPDCRVGGSAPESCSLVDRGVLLEKSAREHILLICMMLGIYCIVFPTSGPHWWMHDSSPIIIASCLKSSKYHCNFQICGSSGLKLVLFVLLRQGCHIHKILTCISRCFCSWREIFLYSFLCRSGNGDRWDTKEGPKSQAASVYGTGSDRVQLCGHSSYHHFCKYYE